MNDQRARVAERIVDAVGVRAGELVQLRDLAGRIEISQEILLAVERRGATPLFQYFPPEYLRQLLATTDPALLTHYDQHRRVWLAITDRMIVLAGSAAAPDLPASPARDTWGQAIERLTLEEERRCIPYLLAAVPSTASSAQLGIALPELDAMIIPALGAPPDELARAAGGVLARLAQAQVLTIHSGARCSLQLSLAGRRWLSDTGTMPAAESLPAGTQAVQNLPAGAVYTTVVETSGQGSLWFPQAGPARDVTLHFEQGRVSAIDAADGAAELAALFDQHRGEPRRISHIGIGLNPYVERTIGWPLIDEHRHGTLLVAFGENRYLGGQNASSLNVDFVIPEAGLLADQQLIIRRGQLIAK